MNTALIISLGAVAISLFVVFISLNAARASRNAKDSGEGVSPVDTAGSDCASSDSGSCGGGD